MNHAVVHFTRIVMSQLATLEELQKFALHITVVYVCVYVCIYFVAEKKQIPFYTSNYFLHLLSLLYFLFAPKVRDHKVKDGKFRLSLKGLKAQKKKRPPDSAGKMQ